MSAEQQSFAFGPRPIRPESDARRNLVIEASAGTGKTTRIVGEVLKLMLERDDLAPERIVLMTFTEKAAGEIADRIRGALETLSVALADPEARGPFQWPAGSAAPLVTIADPERARRAVERHLSNVDSLRSQTIHSFCQSLLRAFPIEAGLDPQFRIVQGFERSLLYGQLYDAWLDEETRVDPQPDVVAEWELLFAHVGYLFFVRELILELVERRDLLAGTGYEFGGVEDFEDRLLDLIARVRSSDERTSDDRTNALFARLRQADPPARGAGIEAWIDYLQPMAPAIRELNLPRGKVPVLKEALKELRAGDDKGSSIHDRLVSHRAAMALVRLARRFVVYLDRGKRQLGVADFDDLLLRTLALLDQAAVLERARAQFDFIFVDEFQDTDRTQAAIIRRLATDDEGNFVPGKLVVVGDPKQSIYGFRRADPETYYAMTQEILRTGGSQEVIERQYRSDAPLIDLVNGMFTRIFPGHAHDPNVFRPEYRPIEAARNEPIRELDARFTVLGVTPADRASRFVAEAEAVADWIEAHRDRKGRDLRQFAVLFRRLSKLDDYLDTLQRRGIDYALPPTRLFLDRPAAVDLVAVLRAIAFAFDRGALISAARSPYFALTDREILDGIAHGEDEARSPWSDFVAAIARFRESSRHLTVSQLSDLVIAACGIEAVYAAMPDGMRHLRHLEHLRAIAFEFDERSGGSVRQFVEEIQSRRKEPDEMEPALADETQNAVRILSVHAAKGLEFETVILPDLAFSAGSGDATRLYTVEEPRSLVMTGRAESISAGFRHTAAGEPLRKIAGMRDDAEMRRLFYVAVTRTMTDVVFVCNLDPKTNNSGFLACLTTALETDRNALPGLFPPEGRELRDTPLGPVAFERAAAAATGEEGTPRLRPRLRDAEREAAIAAAALPPVTVAEPPTAATLLSAAEIAARQSGSRSRAAGILLHRVLELWDGVSEPEPLIRGLAREAAADAETAAIVRRRMATVASSPRLRRIAAARTVGRELTVRFVEDGEAVERRIDRLIREEAGLVVVDYKSGAAEAERVARDTLQVARYCEAVARMTGEPCSGLLWYVSAERDELREVPFPAAEPAEPGGARGLLT